MALFLGDVKSNVATSNNTVVGSPARVRSIYYNATAGAGSIVLKDGGASGTTTISVATSANGYGSIDIPGDGVLHSSNVYANLVNITSMTVFYS